MENMNIASARYVQTEYYVSQEVVVKNAGIQATIDGITMSVPLDPANRHYAEIMRQVEAGELTIQEATQEVGGV